MPSTVLLVLRDPEEAARADAVLTEAGIPVSRTAPWDWTEPGQCPPLLVVLDGSLPGGRAREACRALRGGAWRDVPVGWVGGIEDDLPALAAGASFLLDAPLDPRALVAHVRALGGEVQEVPRLEAERARLRAGDREAAVQEIEGEGDEGLLEAWAQYQAGLARLATGEPQAAAEDFFALVEVRPDFWRAHLRLARLHHDAGFAWEAAEHLRLAQAASPSLGAELPLPVASRPAAPRAAAVVPPATQEAEERPLVLFADDSELALAIIGEHLESAGYRVATAADGKEAVARAAQLRPDLVVLDGLMPGLNGFEACAVIKREVFPEGAPPVLILSAVFTKQRERTEAIEHYGADDLVVKSTDDAALIEAAHRLCPTPGR